jgi:hypothetical protein
MTVLFFRVEDVLNFAETEARSPSGKLGVVDRLVKDLKTKLDEQPVGTQLVLYGEWADDWNFDEEKCTADGKYLIKKLERRGLHIMDKAVGDDPIMAYINRKHVDKHVVLA